MSARKENEDVIHETQTMRITTDKRLFYLYHFDSGKWCKVLSFKEKETALKHYNAEFSEI